MLSSRSFLATLRIIRFPPKISFFPPYLSASCMPYRMVWYQMMVSMMYSRLFQRYIRRVQSPKPKAKAKAKAKGPRTKTMTVSYGTTTIRWGSPIGSIVPQFHDGDQDHELAVGQTSSRCRGMWGAHNYSSSATATITSIDLHHQFQFITPPPPSCQSTTPISPKRVSSTPPISMCNKLQRQQHRRRSATSRSLSPLP